MKKTWVLFVVCLLLSACRPTGISDGETLAERDQQIDRLQAQVIELQEALEDKKGEVEGLQTQVEAMQVELTNSQAFDEVYPLLSNAALAFVRAHTTGNMEALRLLITDEIDLDQKDGIMTASWEEEGRQIEWTLWNENDDIRYQDMVIQGYGQLADGTRLIHIREFYVQEEEELSPPTFLTLFYREDPEGWKVFYFEFDL